MRIRPEQAIESLRSGEGAVSYDRIFQEWIEPASVRDGKGEYYFDVRVYVIGGKAVAGFARRSAAPKDGPIRDSPLSWLTTTGPIMPLARYARANLRNAIMLTEEQIQELRELSTLATVVLDEESTELAYAETYEKIPGFKALAGITDRLEFITLRG